MRYVDEFNTRLEDFEFCFLLHTFVGVFVCSYVLFVVLLNKTLGVEICLTRLNEFCDTTDRERVRFGEINEATVCISSAPTTGRGSAYGDLRSPATAQQRSGRRSSPNTIRYVPKKTELTIRYAMTKFKGKCTVVLLDFLQNINFSEKI